MCDGEVSSTKCLQDVRDEVLDDIPEANVSRMFKMVVNLLGLLDLLNLQG